MNFCDVTDMPKKGTAVEPNEWDVYAKIDVRGFGNEWVKYRIPGARDGSGITCFRSR